MNRENQPTKSNEKEVDSQKEQIEAKEFLDFKGKDLKNIDLGNFSLEILKTCNFDTKTVWPDNLPEGFDPEKIMEEGKNPGLGVRELHKEGITGRGVNVAIIDQKLLLTHEEYADKIVHYEEVGEMNYEPQMHGAAVSSLLLGKECGVAPDSNLHYFAHEISKKDDELSIYLTYIAALNKLIEYNKTLPEKNKVRLVSISKGFNKGVSNLLEDTVKRSEENGIMVIAVEMELFGDDFKSVGTGNLEGDKDNFDGYGEWLSFKKRGYEMTEKQKEETVCIPADYRGEASWKGDREYQYGGAGGASWKVPYLAGLFALALQVNPELSKKEILEKIKQTSVKNKNGLKIINPKGLIGLIKSEKETKKSNYPKLKTTQNLG